MLTSGNIDDMLPKSRIISALLLGIGVALVVWGLVAPRFVHADGRLPLDLEATTYVLHDAEAQTTINSDPLAGVVTTPVTRQLHFEVMDPASADAATIRIGDTFMRGAAATQGFEQERLLSATVASLRIDRLTGEVLSDISLTNQLASPTVNYSVDGIWLKFPTDAQATTYNVIDPTLRQARPADFVESTEINGRQVMHYRQVIDNANVAESFADSNNTTTLTKEDGSTTTGYLFHNVTRDFWVDQKTGLLVDLSESIDDFYGDRTGQKYEQKLLFDASLDDAAVAALVEQAAEVPDAELIETLNKVGIGVGVVLILLGLLGSFGFMSKKRRKA
ncbi:DUF3068 domain-containing protein [Corynebacterium callunae]|uniref:DUF3068 domain-containing protein n=1 Tax=Corynebacterium callunae TaxID=1721 RepID=UPI003982A2C9